MNTTPRIGAPLIKMSQSRCRLTNTVLTGMCNYLDNTTRGVIPSEHHNTFLTYNYEISI
jgi:hypothetical protein